MVLQITIGADGAKETKLRLTHDQSFNASWGVRLSVNNRVVTERLTPVRCSVFSTTLANCGGNFLTSGC
jgi:hypothetical protein